MTLNSLNLLAFGFASPALLGWLALAALPILIHWLFRRRYREVSWAAMQFLYAAVRKQSRRTRLEQLLLLAARVLILALIVLAFARPRWSDAGKLGRETPPTLRVLVLDTSLSLGRKSAAASGSTLLDSAKTIAREIVQKSSAGDRFVLARMAGSEPRLLIRQPTLVSSAVLEEIDRLPQTFERGDVAATLRQLPEVIATKQPNERCEVVVISDFQAENWAVGHVFNVPKFDGHVGNVPHELVLIDVGPALPDNAAVVGLTTDPPLIAAEQPLSVTATLRNAGTTPLTARRVELRLDEQLADSKRVDLPLGQEVVVKFTLTAPVSGEHSLSVRLEEDSLAADNERWLPLRVRLELSVLLVNGRPSGRPRDAATFFVEQALAPNVPHGDRRGLRVATLPESELPNIDLAPHDVVFLCDVGSLTESDVERLRRFAQSGGGVVVSLGPSVSIEKLNEVAFGPRGLMTLQLTEPMTGTNPDGTPAVFGFDPGDFTHPLLREFRGNPGAGLETALIRQFVKVDGADAKQIPREVALRFSTGDPAIVTQSLGRGRCVLAAGHSQPSEGLVGETIVRDWPIAAESATVTLTSPNETTRTLTPRDTHMSPILVIDETTRPGIYTLTSNTTPVTTERLAINVDPRESDPQRIDPKELSSSFSNANSQVVVREGDAPLPPAPELLDTASDSLSLGLLAIVFCLLFVEQALAWRFTAGAVVAILSLVLAVAWSASRFF
ncbi:MAG: hypothetical protein FD138_1171 [Planctomycetota bacterium]|nr:MAG: hypothetical protein FD138_1171 [Planctomycetota bacterium]